MTHQHNVSPNLPTSIIQTEVAKYANCCFLEFALSEKIDLCGNVNIML